jgi:hypothetical protein
MLGEPLGVSSVRPVNYEESRVPAYTLPDALRFNDGSPVRCPEAWRRRRGELLELFAAHVYGTTPTLVATPRFDLVEEGTDALGGRAVRRQVRITVAVGTRSLSMDLLLYLPRGASAHQRVPVFLGLNFDGNHTVAADPAIRLPRRWTHAGDGKAAPQAADTARGRAAAAWPVETILARGYGLATMYYGDIEPDDPHGFADGVRGLFAAATAAGSGTWGALAAWALGLRWACTYLRGDPGVDPARVAVMGHSRLGKAALWAAAQDEGFALVVSNNSGCGGAALFRREFGESVARINDAFPHWFCPAFRQYDDREQELPVDQHMLLALMAPRPLYVASAQDDLWADPRGEFLAALGATPVYRLLGHEGLATREMPPAGRPVPHGRIGYHLRPGGHGVTMYDWECFLEFADRHLGSSHAS